MEDEEGLEKDMTATNVFIDRKVKCNKDLRDGKSWETAFKSIKEFRNWYFG